MSTDLLGDAALQYYEQTRRRVIDSLMANGKVPTDPKEQSNLLKAIDGGVKTVLGVKRLEQESEANKQNQGFHSQIIEMLRKAPTAAQQLQRRKELADVDTVDAKPGEMEIGTKELKYDAMRPDPKNQG